MADSSPSRWQLFKFGLGVFAFALFISLSIIFIVFLMNNSLGNRGTARASQYVQGVWFVVGCPAIYFASWWYIRKRIAQIYRASSDERGLQSRIRVAFWCYLSGWSPILAAGAWIVVMMIRELFRAA